MRLARRPLVAGLLLAVGLGGLTACRTDPTVAAYIGDTRITVSELDSAVDQRLEDETLAAAVQGQEDEYTRRVLGFLVAEQVYAAVSERYGVEVDDDDVRDRLDEILDGQDPAPAFEQAAQQGFSREDVFENIRQQLLRQAIAEEEGQSAGLSDRALRQRFEQDKDQFAQVQFGYIGVPDQATADTVVAQLDANPAAYAQFATQYAGPYTLDTVQPRAIADVPDPLQQGASSAEPNTAFAVPVPDIGAVVVGFVGETVYPAFEDVRDQVQSTVAQEGQDAGTKLVDAVRDDLDITVNPAYGVLDGETIELDDGPLVDILDDQGSGAGDSTGN
jgi:peptidyl-prolyl cis-trans isomerase SurA